MRSSRTTPVPEGRTRWRRFIAATGLTTAMAGTLLYLAASGALAVSFSISGIPFKLSADNLSGTNFIQYATIDAVTNSHTGPMVPADSSQMGSDGKLYDAATITELDTATIKNLHQTVCAPIPGAGSLGFSKPYLLVTLDAGTGDTPVTAKNMVVDAPLMSAANATFTDINIGQDLGLAKGGSANGNFAQHAGTVSIDFLKQLSIGTSAGEFKLAGLSVSATFASSCP